jgi:hypothetical protein
MAGITERSEHIGANGRRRCAPRLECRDCRIICESVVSPWFCLEAQQNCVYAFRDGESTYFGCLHKVFLPELDLGAFGDDGESRPCRSDPYGPVRVAKAPRPQCPVSIERAYSTESPADHCVNPGFVREIFRAREGSETLARDSSVSSDDSATL